MEPRESRKTKNECFGLLQWRYDLRQVQTLHQLWKVWSGKKIGKAKLTVDFTEKYLFLRNTGNVFFADASKVTHPTTVIPSESEDGGGVEPPMDQVLDSLAKSVGILLAEQDMDEDEAEAAFNGFRSKIVTEYQRAKIKEMSFIVQVNCYYNTYYSTPP